MKLCVRPAVKSDAQEITQLVAQVYPPQVLDVIIYGYDGIVRYLEEQISVAPDLADTRYLLTELADNRVAGVIELQYSGQGFFLNQICVAQAFRRTGLGSAMLHGALEMVCPDRQRAIFLDVFDDNIVARDWYRKIGFRCITRSAWWRIPLKVASVAYGRVSGYAQAIACHAAYGFSSFTLSTDSATYTVGRIGRRWFRITNPAFLNDEQAPACLARLDPGRELLGIFPADAEFPRFVEAERLHMAERMTMVVDHLLQRLDKGQE